MKPVPDRGICHKNPHREILAVPARRGAKRARIADIAVHCEIFLTVTAMKITVSLFWFVFVIA
jgi:hypothetical protein